MRTENGYNNMIIPSSKRAMRAVYDGQNCVAFRQQIYWCTSLYKYDNCTIVD